MLTSFPYAAAAGCVSVCDGVPASSAASSPLIFSIVSTTTSCGMRTCITERPLAFSTAFHELDRPQVLEQDHGRCAVGLQLLADQLDVLHLDHAVDLGLEWVEDRQDVLIGFLHFLGGDGAVGVLPDDDHVDHPHDIPAHQVHDRRQDLAFELVAFELQGYKIYWSVCHLVLHSFIKIVRFTVAALGCLGSRAGPGSPNLTYITELPQRPDAYMGGVIVGAVDMPGICSRLE